MSFWTGFTEGLAGSLDRGLQSIMTKRDNELSAAKKFWRERELQKQEKYEEKKEKYDEEALSGYKTLLKGFNGDATKAKAAFDSLIERGGGIGGVTTYVTDLRKTLYDTGVDLSTYDISKDFRGFTEGDTVYTSGEEGVRMKDYTPGRFDAKRLGVAETSAIDSFLGREGPSADIRRTQEEMDKMFPSDAGKLQAAPAGVDARFTGVDTSRLGAARAEKERKQTFDLDTKIKTQRLEQVDLNMGLTEVNIERGKQNIEIDKQMADINKKRFLSDQDQRKLENLRNKKADNIRQKELGMKAEKHKVDMESAKLTVEEQKREAKKAEQYPKFASFEKAIIWGNTQIAAGAKGQELDDLNTFVTNMETAAFNYKAKVENAGGQIEFSTQSLDSIVESARKLQLERVPMKDIEGTMQYVIKGNEAEFFAGMDRVFDVVTKRLTPPDRIVKEDGQEIRIKGEMPAEASRYINELRKQNAMKSYQYGVDTQKRYDDLTKAIEDSAGTRGTQATNMLQRDKLRFVPKNTFDAGVQSIMQQMGVNQGPAGRKYAKDNNLQPGTVIPQGDGEYAIWTGTRYIRAMRQD